MNDHFSWQDVTMAAVVGLIIFSIICRFASCEESYERIKAEQKK